MSLDPKYCSICVDTCEHETTTFVCDHIFCQECIVFWYKKCVSSKLCAKCPLCGETDFEWMANFLN